MDGHLRLGNRWILLAVCGLAPLLNYASEPVRGFLSHTVQFISQYEPPTEPQLRPPFFDHYLFAFLKIAYPIGSTLAYLLGIRIIKSDIRENGAFPGFLAIWSIFIVSGASYLLPVLGKDSPEFLRFTSFAISVVGLAKLARLREMQHSNQESL